MFRELGDRKAEALELLHQANTYGTREDHAKAMAAHLASLKIADDLGNEALVGMNCFRLGLHLGLANREGGRAMLRYAHLMYVRCGRPDYAADVVGTIEALRRCGSVAQDPQSLALDSFFGTTPTPEAILKLVSEHPVLLTPELFSQLESIEEGKIGIRCVFRAIEEDVQVLRGIRMQLAAQERAVAARALTTASSKPGRSCFVAGAAFGDEDTIEVRRLRAWRDRVLLNNRAGKMAVACYYRVGPSIARWIERSPGMRAALRAVLRRLSEVLMAVERY